MKSVFIVDDSPLIIERLINMLEGLLPPDHIGHAGSFTDALTHIGRNPPDILLLDVHLPDKSGVELLRTVRKHYPHITVIMISNQADESYRTACASLGARCFLDKSAQFEQIPALIASLM
jgi:DNA-binding NarL/FixJ family response regulator